MPRKTAIQKLRDELAVQQEFNRNSTSSLAYVRGEREKAREERDQALQELIAVRAHLDNQRRHIRHLFESVYALNIQLSRRDGFIDRVRELDKAVVEPVIEADIGGIVDRERSNLYNASNERSVNRVLDGMDPEILDQVLGRRADED